jgi:hypothetical protein
MCCDSKHGGAVYYRLRPEYGDSKADDELTRCRCSGYPDSEWDGCKCCHKATGEDMRCNRCRAICKECSVVIPKVMPVAQAPRHHGSV